MNLMRDMTLSNHAVPVQGRAMFQNQPCTLPENSKSQGRYEAAKSLNIVRLNVQSLINKEIDTLLKKYLDKFFHPAIVNIKKNLGDESISENNLRMICIQMLDDAKIQYFISQNGMKPVQCTKSEKMSPMNFTPNLRCFKGNQSEYSTAEIAPHFNDYKLQYYPTQSTPNVSQKKKDDAEADNGKNKKKIMRTVTSILPGMPTPIKLVKLEGIRREGPKWDPHRITNTTLFIMGARANKVLGFGQTRGRLYTKHPELFKYSGDTEDKEWLSRNNLMPPTGGIAYLLVLEDIRELAESEDYRRNPNVLLHELKGFLAPDFMLVKIRTFIAQARTEGQEDLTYQYYDPNTFLQGIHRNNHDTDSVFRHNVLQSNTSAVPTYNFTEYSGKLVKYDENLQTFPKQYDVDRAII